MPRPNPLKDRLDESLLDEELDMIKEQFVMHLFDHDIDPTKQAIDQPLVDAIIGLITPKPHKYEKF